MRLGLELRYVPEAHIHPKPHASLEEAQRGVFAIYLLSPLSLGEGLLHPRVH